MCIKLGPIIVPPQNWCPREKIFFEPDKEWILSFNSSNCIFFEWRTGSGSMFSAEAVKCCRNMINSLSVIVQYDERFRWANRQNLFIQAANLSDWEN